MVEVTVYNESVSHSSTRLKVIR